jgi:hypothetical protein
MRNPDDRPQAGKSPASGLQTDGALQARATGGDPRPPMLPQLIRKGSAARRPLGASCQPIPRQVELEVRFHPAGEDVWRKEQSRRADNLLGRGIVSFT